MASFDTEPSAELRRENHRRHEMTDRHFLHDWVFHHCLREKKPGFHRFYSLV
jgi:hypothetical protein